MVVSAYQIVEETMKKGDIVIETSCQKKTKMLVETLTEENLTVVLRETKFHYRRRSRPIFLFWLVWPISFALQERTAFFADQVTYNEWKKNWRKVI